MPNRKEIKQNEPAVSIMNIQGIYNRLNSSPIPDIHVFDDDPIDMRDNSINSIFGLSNSVLDKKVFDNQDTSIFIVKDILDLDSSYRLETIIFFSDNEKDVRSTFYSQERKNNIKNAIREISNGRLEVMDNFREDNLEEQEKSKIYVKSDFGPYYVEIDLGFQNKEAMGKSTKGKIERKGKTLREMGIKSFEKIIERKFRNEDLNLVLLEELEGINDLKELSFKDSASFEKELRFYTNVYDVFLKALYKERNIPMKFAPILLEP